MHYFHNLLKNRRFLGLFAIATFLALSRLFAADAPTLKDAWTDVALGMPDDATAVFKGIPSGSPQGREAEYGEALSLLIKQPMTRGNIGESTSLLQSVMEANASDDLGITAEYFLGRIEEVYSFEPDRAKALAIYTQLFHDHPEHPVAQRAFVKVVLLELYAQITDTERAARFAEIEVEGSKLSDRDAVRDYHLLMALVCDRFGYRPQKRLDHLLAADAVGVTKADTKANLLVSIAELGRTLGHNDLALQYYHRFLAECPRDYRAYTVEQKIAALEKVPK